MAGQKSFNKTMGSYLDNRYGVAPTKRGMFHVITNFIRESLYQLKRKVSSMKSDDDLHYSVDGDVIRVPTNTTPNASVSGNTNESNSTTGGGNFFSNLLGSGRDTSQDGLSDSVDKDDVAKALSQAISWLNDMDDSGRTSILSSKNYRRFVIVAKEYGVSYPDPIKEDPPSNE